jgi:hypothetical protein
MKTLLLNTIPIQEIDANVNKNNKNNLFPKIPKINTLNQKMKINPSHQKLSLKTKDKMITETTY